TGPDSMVTWTFARDLLRDGVDAPSGEGDVQVWPAKLGGGPVSLEVSSPSGHALFELPRQKVVAFLERTYAAVPLDTESRHFDVEAFLSTLTGLGPEG
ncbi:SsgA family sporulation/cell division regulator, partial [Pseudofrankia sp. BMG5.37]